MKLDPPLDLNNNVSSGNCALTWSSSPALEPLTSLLSYELAFKKQEETWEVTLELATPGASGTAAQGRSSSHMGGVSSGLGGG